MTTQQNQNANPIYAGTISAAGLTINPNGLPNTFSSQGYQNVGYTNPAVVPKRGVKYKMYLVEFDDDAECQPYHPGWYNLSR